MRLRSAPLEDWLRDYYFTAEIDISSSGVHSYSMAELRALTGLRHADVDRLVFDDGYSSARPRYGPRWPAMSEAWNPTTS